MESIQHETDCPINHVQTNRWSKWLAKVNRKRHVTTFTAILIVIYKVCAWFLCIKYQQNAIQYLSRAHLLSLPLPALRSRTHGCSMRGSQEVKLHTQRHLTCERHTKRSDLVFSRTDGSAGSSITSSNILRFWGPNCTGFWNEAVQCATTIPLSQFLSVSHSMKVLRNHMCSISG